MQQTFAVDEHHWWYRGRRRIIRAELERLALPARADVLDAGCGSGRTMQELVDFGTVSGIELNEDAAALARVPRATARSRSAASRSCPGRTPALTSSPAWT